MSKKLSLEGAEYGSLKWREEAAPYLAPCGASYRRGVWDCECGGSIVVRNSDVMSGNTSSCGCESSRVVGTHLRHGQSRRKNSGQTRAYASWLAMKQRCTDPKHKGWKRYGGKGITVYPAWNQSYEQFFSYMGECPKGLSIDRWPNPDGNYEPGNVRWATPKEQARNTARNVIVTVRGITGCLVELCEHFHVSYGLAQNRIYCGWPAELAFFSPKNMKLKVALAMQIVGR